MATWIPVAVAAIDFGSAFSGWAMSFRHDYEREPSKVYTKSWNSGEQITPKTPTSILIDPDGKTLTAFGYDAENKYTELSEDGKHDGYFFFRKFKMTLYNNRNISRVDTLIAENGKPLPASLVFQLAIRYLKDDLLRECGKQISSGLNATDFHWTVTVPAIWNEQAKNFMREASIQAGIDNDKLTIVLEPEAASCFCLHVPMIIAGEQIVSLEPGASYILVDCGGGTTDICCHEILEDGKLKEIHRASGNAIGGNDVDIAFNAFLVKLFSSKCMEKFKKRYSGDHLSLIRSFEIKKRECTSGEIEKVTIGIPSQLIDLLPSNDMKKAVKKAGYKGRVEVSAKTKLRINMDCFEEEIYQDVMERFRNTITQVCSHRKLRDVKTVILVGGFSESTLLQKTAKKALPDKTVIIIQEAGLAVLKGAVIYGHNDSVIETRIARFTYGINFFEKYDDTNDPVSQSVRRKSGIQHVYRLHVILEAEQEILADQQEEGGVILVPLSESQPTISCHIYVVDGTGDVPNYVPHERCSELGKISAPITDMSVPLEQREFMFKFKFGGTEIKASCVEISTGKTVEASIDLLDSSLSNVTVSFDRMKVSSSELERDHKT